MSIIYRTKQLFLKKSRKQQWMSRRRNERFVLKNVSNTKTRSYFIVGLTFFDVL